MDQPIHQFKVWFSGQWYLCPRIYTDAEFEDTMDQINWQMPLGIAAVHSREPFFHPVVQLILDQYSRMDCDIAQLFRNQPPMKVKLKDKVRHREMADRYTTGNKLR